LDNLDDIVKGCIDGKSSAQEKLYKLFSRKMYGVCLHLTKDQDSAEEILQEGFIKVFNNLAQFKNLGSFEGWVRKIMVNTALEHYRKQTHFQLVNEQEIANEEISFDDIESDILAEDLMTFIQELTPQYRMVFSLYAIEGYSHAEISDMMTISVGTSKSNLSRARKILQDRVIETYGNDIAKNRKISW